MAANPLSANAKTLVRLQLGLLVVLGVVLGELAALWALSSPIDELLADSAGNRPAVVAAHTTLDAARADRARLDSNVMSAQKAVDDAVVRANCEVNPKPGCPIDGHVTGVAGSGSETDAARAARSDAMESLDAAKAARADQGPRVDARITAAQGALAAVQAQAPVVNSSVGARWMALNNYSLAHVSAGLLRLLLVILFVVICVAPLLYARWRGESAAKRLARAEAEADAEIAIKQAEMRAEAEKLKAEQDLEKARIAAEADLFLEQEKQRRRVAAELGTQSAPELENARGSSGMLALAPAESSMLPAPLQGLSAPLQGIASLASSVLSLPGRAAATVVEEFEELTFTITRKRRVTVSPDESGAALTSADSAVFESALVVEAEVVDELPTRPTRALPRVI